MKNKIVICSLIAVCLASASADAGNLLGYPLPENETVAGIRFLKPFLESGDNVSTMSGAWQFEGNVSMGRTTNLLITLPLVHAGIDYGYYSESETKIGNAFFGLQIFWSKTKTARQPEPKPKTDPGQYSEIGSTGNVAEAAENTAENRDDDSGTTTETATDQQSRTDPVSCNERFSGVMLGLHLPTSSDNFTPAIFGWLADNTSPQKYLPNTTTPVLMSFSRFPIGENGHLDTAFGPMFMIPEEGSGQVFLNYRATLCLGMQDVNMLMEFRGLLAASEEYDDFSDRFTNVLSLGCELAAGPARPALFLTLPTDDMFTEVVDWTLGVRLNMQMP